MPVSVDHREHLFAAVSHANPTDVTPAVVFDSQDGAQSWVERDAGLAKALAGAADGLSLAADERLPGRLIVGIGSGLIVSSDFGKTWSVALGDSAAAGPGVLALAIGGSLAAPRVWAGGQYIDTNGFAYYSDDGGKSWKATLQRPGGTAGDNNFVASALADSTSRDHLYVGMPNAVWETVDGGAAWSVVLRTNLIGTVTALLRTGRGLVAVSDESEVKEGYPIRSVLGIYISHDEGRSWSPMLAPAGAEGGHAAVSESDSTILIGTAAGIWRVRLP